MQPTTLMKSRIRISNNPSYLVKNVRRIACQAQDPKTTTPSTDPPPPRPPMRPPSPYPPGVKLQRVERLGAQSWGGVAGVDKGDSPPDLGKLALLIGGDTLSLCIFASIGRMSHSEGMALGAVIATALPFLIGWHGSAAVLGGYGAKAQNPSSVGEAALVAFKCWIVGAPVGIVLRSISRGYLPDKSFLIVAMVATAVLLIGWRSALTAATGRRYAESSNSSSSSSSSKKKKNRKGGVFEFVQLLQGLVGRW
jgi:hypothetical protein